MDFIPHEGEWGSMTRLSNILKLFCYSSRPQWDECGRLRQYPDHTVANVECLADRFGRGIWGTLRGSKVLDYGCGQGTDVIECAQHSIEAVGIEVRPSVLERARQHASAAGVKAEFRSPSDCSDLQGAFDYVLSVNCFEHYLDPAAVLRHMRWFMKPSAVVLIYFGPPWLHPYGAHLRTLISLPWAHLLFPESTVMGAIADYREDKPKSYMEIAGGLNRLTIRKFLRYIAESPLSLRSFELIPIRGLWPLIKVPGVREFFTSTIRAELVPRVSIVLDPHNSIAAA
jgi:SAM-dependent methyltransferase